MLRCVLISGSPKFIAYLTMSPVEVSAAELKMSKTSKERTHWDGSFCPLNREVVLFQSISASENFLYIEVSCPLLYSDC